MNATRILRYGDTLTLHYRISALDGKEIDSTFEGEPITLTLGQGELAEGLERCLLDLPLGERRLFRLQPHEAFGESRPELVQFVPLAQFGDDISPRPGALIEFSLPNGDTLAGTVKEVTPEHAVMDFNHPLSDCPILFEVEAIALRD
jgi:FKBP-type peptidyl-prolyl cis-trans isomerase 2